MDQTSPGAPTDIRHLTALAVVDFFTVAMSARDTFLVQSPQRERVELPPFNLFTLPYTAATVGYRPATSGL